MDFTRSKQLINVLETIALLEQQKRELLYRIYLILFISTAVGVGAVVSMLWWIGSSLEVIADKL
jgi:hypothetical protein